MGNSFYISTDRSKMDVNFIHDYLCNRSYWAKGRTLESVKRSLEHSVCLSAFTREGKQIGFARFVTDYVVFAWVMDVFVIDGYQGKGIGKSLIQHILDYPGMDQVKGIGLRTNDAHALYQKFGFGEILDTETWMIRKRT